MERLLTAAAGDGQAAVKRLEMPEITRIRPLHGCLEQTYNFLLDPREVYNIEETSYIDIISRRLRTLIEDENITRILMKLTVLIP